MPEEPKVFTKTVEVEMVEMNIQVTKAFFDTMQKAKADVAQKRGFDITNGEYIEQAMDDMVYMIESLHDQLTAEQYQEGLPEVVETKNPENMYH
jgi:hypothetical protein